MEFELAGAGGQQLAGAWPAPQGAAQQGKAAPSSPRQASLADGVPQRQRVLQRLPRALGQEGGGQVGRVAQQAHAPAPPHLRVCKARRRAQQRAGSG